jgi:hypothetical protein
LARTPLDIADARFGASTIKCSQVHIAGLSLCSAPVVYRRRRCAPIHFPVQLLAADEGTDEDANTWLRIFVAIGALGAPPTDVRKFRSMILLVVMTPFLNCNETRARAREVWLSGAPPFFRRSVRFVPAMRKAGMSD